MPRETVRLYLESTLPGGLDLTLPQSGVHVNCAPSPVLETGDIASARVTTLPLGSGVSLNLTAEGYERLRANLGRGSRRVVMVVNDRPVGVVRLSAEAANGPILMFLEVPEPDLPQFVGELNSAAGD